MSPLYKAWTPFGPIAFLARSKKVDPPNNTGCRIACGVGPNMPIEHTVICRICQGDSKAMEKE
jgi:hypothetical protein